MTGQLALQKSLFTFVTRVLLHTHDALTITRRLVIIGIIVKNLLKTITRLSLNLQACQGIYLDRRQFLADCWLKKARRTHVNSLTKHH